MAELQKEKSAVRSNSWALEAEKAHAGMYSEAKVVVEAGKDAEVGQVYICPVCS